jgi:hypothetical protein
MAAGLQDDVVAVDQVDESVLLVDARDQAPDSVWRRGSGLPIPSKGSRAISSSS